MDQLSIQSSFHIRASRLHNSTKHIEDFQKESVELTELIRGMRRLHQFWLDHPAEIDALYDKLKARRSPYSAILPFYGLIRGDEPFF